MSIRLSHILSRWFAARDQQRWVLGIVTSVEGSSYRKPGAMMLFNDVGGQLGLLSGGCLEADLCLRARKLMASGTRRRVAVCYDMNDEDDIAFQLGLGCGGKIEILLHTLDAEDDYLGLPGLLECLQQHKAAHYQIKILAGPDKTFDRIQTAASAPLWRLNTAPVPSANEWLMVSVEPDTHLLIVGGGIDAQPLVAIAARLGWRVTLVDPRPAYARAQYFPEASQILHCSPADLDEDLCKDVDAAMVMAHNLDIDAAALATLASSQVRYLGLLGPDSRRQEVMKRAGIDASALPVPLAGPAGLRLGAQLPETIALAILAECQAVLAGTDATSMTLSLSRISHSAPQGA